VVAADPVVVLDPGEVRIDRGALDRVFDDRTGGVRGRRPLRASRRPPRRRL